MTYEKVKAYQKKYREEHRDERRAYFRKRYADNKTEMKMRLSENRMMRRAKIKNLPHERIRVDQLYERDNQRCGICNLRVKRNERSVDHIVPISMGGGYTWDNVQLAHTLCNIRRGKARLPVQMRLSGGFEIKEHDTLPPAKRKLTTQQVEYIRSSTKGYGTLARELGVGRSTVRDVKKGYTWSAPMHRSFV